MWMSLMAFTRVVLQSGGDGSMSDTKVKDNIRKKMQTVSLV